MFRTEVDYASIAGIEVLCPATCPPPDTSAPLAPTGLVATGSTGGISLDWANNTETDLAGYNVYRSPSATGTFTKVNAQPDHGVRVQRHRCPGRRHVVLPGHRRRQLGQRIPRLGYRERDPLRGRHPHQHRRRGPDRGRRHLEWLHRGGHRLLRLRHGRLPVHPEPGTDDHRLRRPRQPGDLPDRVDRRSDQRRAGRRRGVHVRRAGDQRQLPGPAPLRRAQQERRRAARLRRQHRGRRQRAQQLRHLGAGRAASTRPSSASSPRTSPTAHSPSSSSARSRTPRSRASRSCPWSSTRRRPRHRPGSSSTTRRPRSGSTGPTTPRQTWRATTSIADPARPGRSPSSMPPSSRRRPTSTSRHR